MLHSVSSTGVSSAGMYHDARTSMLSAQKQLSRTTAQLDGQKGHRYSDFAGQVHVLTGFESRMAVLEGTIANNATLDQALVETGQALDSVMGTLQRFRESMLYDMNTQNRGVVDLRARANESLAQLVADLNRTDAEGHYIFSGSRLQTPPVNMAAAVLPHPGSGPSTPWFQGDHLWPACTIREGQTLVCGVAADHPAFEQLLRAYTLVATAPGQEPERQEWCREAFDLLNNGFNDLVGLVSETGQHRKTLLDTRTNLEQLKADAEDHIRDLMYADPAEVITRWTTLQAQLQMTLMVVQRLQQTCLATMMS
jgi:flagellar hook-associated protein 3 FlgL